MGARGGGGVTQVWPQSVARPGAQATEGRSGGWDAGRCTHARGRPLAGLPQNAAGGGAGAGPGRGFPALGPPIRAWGGGPRARLGAAIGWPGVLVGRRGEAPRPKVPARPPGTGAGDPGWGRAGRGVRPCRARLAPGARAAKMAAAAVTASRAGPGGLAAAFGAD